MKLILAIIKALKHCHVHNQKQDFSSSEIDRRTFIIGYIDEYRFQVLY